jgi:Helix-turn-helix domain
MAKGEKDNSLVLDLWPTVGNLLHLSRATTYLMASQGKIPTIKLGKKILCPRVRLEAMLAGQTEEKSQ